MTAAASLHPEAARERADAAAASVGVWAFDGEHGLKTLVAKAASGDVTWFLAAVDRIPPLKRAFARQAMGLGVLPAAG